MKYIKFPCQPESFFEGYLITPFLKLIKYYKECK